MPRQRSPPPPYSRDDPLPTFPGGNPPPYTATRPSRRVSRSLIRVPGIVNAYWPRQNGTCEFYLGEGPDSLLFRVIRGSPSSSQSLKVLYLSPDTDALALGRFNGPNPTDPDDEGTVEICSPNRGETRVVRLSSQAGMSPTRYFFTMAVGEDNMVRLEDFEWRRSRGGEVRSVDQDATGWKLVRLGPSAPTGGHGGSRAVRPLGETSDGKEVVAIWVTNDRNYRPGRPPFHFELRGNGRNSTLGKYFGFVALMSALRISCTSAAPSPPIRHHGRF
ncbi:hypothetical protein GGR52DRAFT_569601 [Hypoxylon sp. FL1284]|nr:hypothetical protein GGR52DRAFT_569601 [Hypoxylon sp. FL1284]